MTMCLVQVTEIFNGHKQIVKIDDFLAFPHIFF